MSRSLGIRLAVIAVAVAFVPAVATAQEVKPGEVADKKVTAEDLHEQAFELSLNQRNWGQAATLYIRSASAMPKGDPRAVQSLQLAGRLYYALNQPVEARRALEDAADAALMSGDVVTAAHTLLDAALIAEHQSRPADVIALSNRAEMLSRSSLLQAEQRDAIVSRIKRLPAQK
jgi:hypothetical protein